jgi:hypothetical protein
VGLLLVCAEGRVHKLKRRKLVEPDFLPRWRISYVLYTVRRRFRTYDTTHPAHQHSWNQGNGFETGVVHEFLLRLGRSRFDWSIGGQLGASMIPAAQQTRSFGRAPYSQKRRAAVTLFQNPRPSVSRTHLEWRFILQGFEVNLR